MSILPRLRPCLFVLLALAISAASLVVTDGTAQAAPAFGTPQSVNPPDASCSVGSSDSAVAADGTVRGFLDDHACTGSRSGGHLTLFTVSPSGAVTDTVSPYSGRVGTVAWDGRDTLYVVFLNCNQLDIASYVVSRRVFSPVTRLATGEWPRRVPVSVVASNGKWWAVWSSFIIYSGFEDPPYLLFQAHTLLGTQKTTQITCGPTHGCGFTDSTPSLAFTGSRLTLTWTRTEDMVSGPDQEHAPSHIQIATSTGGPWTSRAFTAGGTRNFNSSAFAYAGHVTVAFMRDSNEVVVATDVNESGFATRGLTSDNSAYERLPLTVAVSGTSVFTAWTNSTTSVQVAERANGVWSQTAPLAGAHQATRVMGQGGRGLLLFDRVQLTRQS